MGKKNISIIKAYKAIRKEYIESKYITHTITSSDIKETFTMEVKAAKSLGNIINYYEINEARTYVLYINIFAIYEYDTISKKLSKIDIEKYLVLI